MKVLYAISLAILCAGCMPGCTTARPTVSRDSIDEFLEIVERRDFHGMTQTGKEVFEQGLYIPNHAALLGQFPSSEPRSGHTRYVFYSFRGQASAGEVYLILESDSGRIVEFNHVEAWFE